MAPHVGRLQLIVVWLLVTCTALWWGGTTLALIELADDGVGHLLQLLELVLEIISTGILVAVQELNGLVCCLLELLLGLLTQLGPKLLLVIGLVLEPVGIRLELVALLYLLLDLLVFLRILLGVLDHALNLLWGQAVLVVCDGDLLLLARALLLGRHAQDAVDIDLKGHVDLGHTAGGWGDARQVEGAEQVVVLGHGTLTLVYLDRHRRLVVCGR
eukprot:comp19561_c0_seq1/m.22957 comp19561_c0_seq1/g.22957  ORF comp19561_c0_seq1/g.22957 comp19561_c0_seq1/m.22957 type:complete len:215 (+) comp19561_c0_seq1:110-754(+)